MPGMVMPVLRQEMAPELFVLEREQEEHKWPRTMFTAGPIGAVQVSEGHLHCTTRKYKI